MGADPPSLIIGESITATVTSSDSFFIDDVDTPIASEGGLVIQSVTITDSKHAVISMVSTPSTQIGSHTFELDIDGVTGLLDVSVLSPGLGAGTASASDAVATAGASGATLTIRGNGTHFDSKCTARVEGADGFQAISLDAVDSSLIQINYSIELDQEPTDATIVLLDGAYRYEIPFTIISPTHYESQSAEQVLTKGQAGWITLTHPDANLHWGTRLALDDEAIEVGEIEILDDGEARIPVRVPFDFESNSLTFKAHTLLNGGSFLETIQTEVKLVSPAYIATVPSRLSQQPGEHEVEIVSAGFDLLQLEGLSIDDESVSITNWNVQTSEQATATIVLSDIAEEGAYRILASDGQLSTTGMVVITDGNGRVAHRIQQEIPRGDHIYFPIVIQGADLKTDSTALLTDEDIEVIDLIFLDSGSLVAELSIDPEAEHTARTMVLRTEEYDYEIHVSIIDSKI